MLTNKSQTLPQKVLQQNIKFWVPSFFSRPVPCIYSMHRFSSCLLTSHSNFPPHECLKTVLIAATETDRWL